MEAIQKLEASRLHDLRCRRRGFRLDNLTPMTSMKFYQCSSKMRRATIARSCCCSVYHTGAYASRRLKNSRRTSAGNMDCAWKAFDVSLWVSLCPEPCLRSGLGLSSSNSGSLMPLLGSAASSKRRAVRSGIRTLSLADVKSSLTNVKPRAKAYEWKMV